MDDKLDLWGNVTVDKGSASYVLSLLQEQANLLATKTNCKVKADFSQVHYQYKTEQSSIKMMETMLKSISTLSSAASIIPKQEIIEVDERNNLEDASHFYEQGEYKFEIYSDKYKFRLFTLEYQSVFPLKFEIEYGILEDKVITESVKSIDEVKSLIRSIFTSNKVRFIIQKMMELDEN